MLALEKERRVRALEKKRRVRALKKERRVLAKEAKEKERRVPPGTGV